MSKNYCISALKPLNYYIFSNGLLKQFNCEKAVFTHLIVVNKYYNAYLPPHIIERYANLPIDTVENQFLSYLKVETYKIVSKTAVGGHFKSLKSIRSVPVLLRYLKEVLFPGKEFMVEKYGLQSKEQRAKIKDGKKNTSSYHHNLSRCVGIITSKFWWLWYPYRWFMGLKGFWYVVTGTSTSSVTSTEKRKEK